MANINSITSKARVLELLNSGAVALTDLPEAIRGEIAALLEKEAVENARQSYAAFVKLMGPVMIDGFVWGRHIEIMCNLIQEKLERIWCKDGIVNRLMANLPPGGGKSQFFTRFSAAWALGRWPHLRVILVGHTLDFARGEFTGKVRDIMWTDEYKKIFPNTVLREDKQTEGRFLTTQGGECIAASPNTKLAGRRAHLIICDDALVEGDAKSPAVRADVCDGYIANIRSRLLHTPDGAELMIGTRWVEGDLFDYLEEQDRNSGNPWELFKIPAILDAEASRRLRRPGDAPELYEVGSSFWPEFVPLKKLEITRNSLATNIGRWNAVYMQNPIPEDGELIRKGDFKKWKFDTAPQCHTIVMTLDTAYTKNAQSDYTAYQIWGLFNHMENGFEEKGNGFLRPNAILLDAKKGKWDYPELTSLIEDVVARKKVDIVLIEERSSGLALIPDLQKRGLPVIPWKSEKDKFMRMQSAAPFIKSGVLWVPYPENRPDIIQKSMDWVGEITKFPNGKHDDHPDALSQFIIWARDNNIMAADGYEYTPLLQSDEDEDEENYNYSAKGTYTANLW